MPVIHDYYPRNEERIQDLRDYLIKNNAEEVGGVIALRNPGNGSMTGIIGVYNYSDSTVVLRDSYETLTHLSVASGDFDGDDTKAKEVFGELEAVLKGEEVKSGPEETNPPVRFGGGLIKKRG
ncbi:MAG: hypothetical protein ABH849_01375 [Nanoarchaeota archaeon]